MYAEVVDLHPVQTCPCCGGRIDVEAVEPRLQEVGRFVVDLVPYCTQGCFP